MPSPNEQQQMWLAAEGRKDGLSGRPMNPTHELFLAYAEAYVAARKERYGR